MTVLRPRLFWRRRLFWRVYLTLLASLVAVALIMGCFWWVLGGAQREGWGASHIQLTAGLPSRPAAAFQPDGEGRDPDDGINTEVSVYGADGTLIAAHGRPIMLSAAEGEAGWARRHAMRVDLPDGRIVLTRFRPLREPGGRILTVMLIVAGGVGLAAFPVTARLTRRLEGLRSGMARWGGGELSARVDEAGSDEVALVARTFNAAAGRVDALLASQKALLANASHELRSPLARLRIAVELWLPDPAVAADGEIVRNLAEVDQLVEEILLFSRLDHPGSEAGRLERVDLLGLAAEEAVRFGAAASGDPVEIDGDARLLRRLLRNLLENAAKHGQPPIQVGVSRHGGAALVVVSDHGPGIPLQERDRVFEPFYRPAGHSEAGGGWGLGLSLVRQIAERHGGHVECEAASDGGSRFVVHLMAGQAHG